ncbi:PilZ domain-containing protein [Vibrio porteresiae]|uniref:Cyclic diguanosine monophosphate-binding protein n=1 Tax=Vibrio porteresiae DSM 19223 TaxID=1123496 RepID=A0ABZ0QB02_9VIBR|nr:PilZ domain-containing protein [Vibrio porteresiae]WPC73585.1 PilZ domain-containing protein [Vibrio porteresiae DSM 19223]
MERRRFLRVIYQAPASLTQCDISFNAMVKDISLHGLLVSCETPQALLSDKPIEVNIPLSGSDVSIQLTAQIVDLRSNLLRLQVDHIDLESLGHLKRLVELNMGNDELLHRDLDHLMDQHDI